MLDPQSQEIEVNVHSVRSKRALTSVFCIVTAGLARTTLTRAKKVFFLLVSCARLPCVRLQTLIYLGGVCSS